MYIYITENYIGIYFCTKISLYTNTIQYTVYYNNNTRASTTKKLICFCRENCRYVWYPGSIYTIYYFTSILIYILIENVKASLIFGSVVFWYNNTFIVQYILLLYYLEHKYIFFFLYIGMNVQIYLTIYTVYPGFSYRQVLCIL